MVTQVPLPTVLKKRFQNVLQTMHFKMEQYVTAADSQHPKRPLLLWLLSLGFLRRMLLKLQQFCSRIPAVLEIITSFEKDSDNSMKDKDLNPSPEGLRLFRRPLWLRYQLLHRLLDSEKAVRWQTKDDAHLSRKI